jgi:hypothetical protein
MRHLVALLVPVAACAPSMPTLAPLGPSITPSEVRTWDDVSPIFEAHCVSCHQEGSIGTFRLDTYAEAAPWATAVAEATMNRSMPPFLVRGDGTCGDYADNHWLSDDELQSLTWWAEQGAPEGTGQPITPTAPPSLAGITDAHTTPDFVPEIVGGELSRYDEYRCFAVPLPEETTFLTGYDVAPGNDAIVHHVIGMPVLLSGGSWDERTNGHVIEAVDGADGRDGWPCFSEAGDGIHIESQVISWAPGQGPVSFPEGVGLRLEAGTVMVYQVHYNLSDPATLGQADQTTIHLRLADEVDREAVIDLTDGFLGGWSTPGRLAADTAGQEVYFPIHYWGDDDVLGVLPHMHERGTALRVDVRRAGQDTCLMEVPAWDFEWQRMYMFAEPVRLQEGDRLRVWCRYDTTGDTEPVLPGWGTRNEMCLPGLLLAAREED